MCVEVTFIGRLGNNFFQYALGRMIAEHFGLELRCFCPEDKPVQFMGRGVELGPPATLSALSTHFPNAPMSVSGTAIMEPVDSFDVYANPAWDGQRIDLEGILTNGAPRRIQLAGYFQRYEYFRPFREQLRQWFHPENPQDIPEIASGDVLISIRRGVDYEIRKWILPMKYYHQALAEIGSSGRVFVCGTCINERVREELDRYNPIYFDGTPLEHLCFMMRFGNIITSNSTFAWWGAFLSDATRIYAPRSRNGKTFAPSGFGDVDLHMRERRYHEIPVDGIATVGFPVSPLVKAVDKNEFADRLAVIYSDGAFAEMPLDARNYDWLQKSIQSRQPVSPAWIRENFVGADLSLFIEQLIKARILLQEPVQLER